MFFKAGENLQGSMRTLRRKDAFTLIEILIVIGIIAILAAIVIVAINPARQFSQARDTQRWAHVNAILNAVYQYAADNKGNLPSTITTGQLEICVTSAASCTGLIDLSVLTTSEIYLVSMPTDPLCDIGQGDCSTYGTGYNILKSVNGRVTVAADGEINQSISITR